jgi:hypothetical protein
MPLRHCAPGEMPEWSIGAVSKTVVRVTGPGVRIPLSPQTISLTSAIGGSVLCFTAEQARLAGARDDGKYKN